MPIAILHVGMLPVATKTKSTYVTIESTFQCDDVAVVPARPSPTHPRLARFKGHVYGQES